MKNTNTNTKTTITNTKQATTDRLTALMEKRNNILKSLETLPAFRPLENYKSAIVNDLCETVAQIAVYKTLLRLSDGAKDIGTNGAKMCEKLYQEFVFDMVIYRTKDYSKPYSDAFDLFILAYTQVWQYLKGNAPLSLDDTVLTIVNKSGKEKNYTIFQTACKSIREYIRSWSTTDGYKKLHYLIGYTENGKAITTRKKPQDDLTDIEQEQKTAFLNRYKLTAQQQEIMLLVIDGKKPLEISTTLNIPLRTVQDNIKKAKAKISINDKRIKA